MQIEILGVAAASPPHRLSQVEALAMAHRICCSDERQIRLANALYRYSGIDDRYTVVPSSEAGRWLPSRGEESESVANAGPTTQERMAYYEEHALPLALDACREALRAADISPAAITHVVTASCTGFSAPGVDCGLIRELNLRPTTERTHVGYMGCHAAINALRVAHGLANAHPRARILVSAVELCSLHYCFHWDSARMLGNALFADGAGAVVLGTAAGDKTDGTRGRWRVAATGSYIFPNSEELMTWRIGDHGFAMSISPRLPELIAENLRPWLTEWLAEQNLSERDVASWAIHPGGPRIVEAVEAALGLSPVQTRASREVLRQFGNMSSATLLFILKSLIDEGAPRPCVMLGFGPGLVAEAALIS